MSEELEIDVGEEGVDVSANEPSEAEIKASEQGWTTKEEWNGDPEKWVDAESFLERGEKHNGILRERNGKLIAKVETLENELRESIRKFGEATRSVEERAYQRALADLQDKQIQAVENADTETFRQLEEKKQTLTKEFSEATKEPEKTYSPDTDPVFIQWHQKNQWYNDDVEMSLYADQIAPIVATKMNGRTNTPEFYDEISSQVKKKFSDKFRNTNRDKPGAVQGVGHGGSQKKGKSYNDLPPEAKAACDDFVAQKLLTKEQYVADFFGE